MSEFLRPSRAHFAQHIVHVFLEWNMEFQDSDEKYRRGLFHPRQAWQFNDIHKQLQMLEEYAPHIKSVMLLNDRQGIRDIPLHDATSENTRIRAMNYLEMILGWEKLERVAIETDLFCTLMKGSYLPSIFLKRKWLMERQGSFFWSRR